MRNLAWIALLCASQQTQEVRHEVELKVQGLWSPECHAAIRTSMRALTGVEDALFVVDAKGGNRLLLVLKSDFKELLLSQIGVGLATAARERKGAITNMVVEYRVDEDLLRLPTGTEFIAVDGRRKTEIETTFTELKKVWKATDVSLPKRERCTFSHLCPAKCSVSNSAGTCPACLERLVEKPKPPTGGC